MRQAKLSRHLEKCASLGWGRVSLGFPSSFTADCQVEHGLIADREQIIQPIDLGCGIREASTSTHHSMEVGGVLRVEGQQHGDDSVPRGGASRRDAVTARSRR